MASTITISYSELDTARQCPLKHELAYKQRWQKPPRPGGALARGTLWHQVLEGHYRILKQAQDEGWRLDTARVNTVLEQSARDLLYDDRGEQSEDQALVEWMYDRYLRAWGLDDDWDLRAIEHHAEFYLPTPSGHRSRFKIKMKLDLVIKDANGRLWIVDHKSGRNLPDQKMLEFNDQFGLYTWGLRHMGRQVYGALHNATRTQRNKDDSLTGQPPDTLNRRTRIYRTDTELNMIAIEAYRTARMMWSIPLGEAPRHTNEDTCGWRCDFKEVCLASRKGGDLTDMLESTGFEQVWTRH